MKLKHLESALHDVDGFQCPNIALEQYMTSPHLAAVMVHTMHGLGDIEDRRVLDLGVGCGMLSVASALMGSRCVVGVDVDETALESARANVDELELNDVIDLVRGDVNTLRMRKFDTVIMNPPFGTRCKGIDMAFIRTALDLATSAVYSLHKTSTRQHILKKAREWGAEAKVLAELRFDLPQSYGFHKLQSKDIQVDFIRLVPRQR
ncbi:Methyltransferase-like protein 5 [Plasmodiophora brassicae]